MTIVSTTPSTCNYRPNIDGVFPSDVTGCGQISDAAIDAPSTLTTTPSVPMLAAFASGLTGPWLAAPLEAIWVSKTPPDIQGRVFSSVGIISQLTYPIGLVAVTSLSDTLSPSTLLVLSGGALSATALLWRFRPALQNIDALIPDLELALSRGAYGDAARATA